MTKQFDLNALDDDDIIIVDNSRDETDENITAMVGDETAEIQRDEDIFDLEEEIELEYESDEDEDEHLELDDERDEDNQDFVDLMLGISKEPDQDGNDHELTEYFEFETHGRDDIIVLDTNSDPDTEVIALAEDAAPDFTDRDDLPDLEDISGFDFDSEEDAEDSPVVDQLEPDSSDDIIARAVEQSLDSGDDREQIDLAGEAEFGLKDNDAILDLNGTRENDDEIALADDELLNFENDEDLLDLDEGADLGDDDGIIPLDGFNDINAEHDDEIIEITEFDQHFPAGGEALLDQSGVLGPSGADEEDFLELFDIEEDSLSDDEGIIGFNDSTEKTETDRINQFFSDDLEDDQPESLTPESIFEDFSGKKSGLDDETIEVAEQAPDMNAESTTDAEISVSEDEKFEFNFDPDSIAQQVDRLDTFLAEDSADEPAVASLPVNQVAAEEKEGEETGLEEPRTGPGIGELPAVPPGQIDAAIERVIVEKFSGKIENIIYEVIEKAVAKEIVRIKESLMGSNAIDDNQD